MLHIVCVFCGGGDSVLSYVRLLLSLSSDAALKLIFGSACLMTIPLQNVYGGLTIQCMGRT